MKSSDKRASDSLDVGEKSIVCKMDVATLRTHPPEQSGYVISGKYYMTENGKSYILTFDDSYAIPGNTPRSFEVTEGGEVRDVFTPVREGSL